MNTTEIILQSEVMRDKLVTCGTKSALAWANYITELRRDARERGELFVPFWLSAIETAEDILRDAD